MPKIIFERNASKKFKGTFSQAVEYTVDDKTGIITEINGKPVPVSSVTYLMANGLSQALRDSYASAKDVAETQGAFDKKLDAILSGKATVRTGGRAPAITTLEGLIAAGVHEYLVVRAAKSGAKVPAKSSDRYAALVEAVLASNRGAAIREEAERKFAEQADLLDDDDGLEDIFNLIESDDDEADESDESDKS